MHKSKYACLEGAQPCSISAYCIDAVWGAGYVLGEVFKHPLNVFDVVRLGCDE